MVADPSVGDSELVNTLTGRPSRLLRTFVHTHGNDSHFVSLVASVDTTDWQGQDSAMTVGGGLCEFDHRQLRLDRSSLAGDSTEVVSEYASTSQVSMRTGASSTLLVESRVTPFLQVIPRR